MFYPMYMDSSYFSDYFVFILIPLIISLWASASVKSTFNKYSRVSNNHGLTASEVARNILRSAGVLDVRIERVSGNLSDHYDPRTKVVRLSDSVYDSTSVAAIGVAAHEVGHAIQHATGYVPNKLRSALVPVVNLASSLAVPMLFMGILIGATGLSWLGIIFFASTVVFSLVTLPVEFNASGRAIKNLIAYNILSPEENEMAKKVLNAAAMTYVASALASIGQLLFWISRTRRDD